MLLRRTLIAASALATLPAAGRGAEVRTVRLGQATPAVSFLPVAVARALDSFAGQGLRLDWAAISGGDPACLAALDSGDVDLVAVGSETLLNAIGKRQPFQMVASLMSKVSLELVVSNTVLERSGVDPGDDPLPKRLALLKGATVGVSAIGGTQDRAARWLAREGGLDPKALQVAMAGPPPSIQGALEAGRVDAFVLSPPEGLIAEDNRTGRVVVRMGDEFPALKGVPSLVLAVKTPVRAETRAILVSTLKALQAACAQLAAEPKAVAAKVQAALYPRIKPPVMETAILGLANGVATRGALDVGGVMALLAYAGDAAAGLNIKGEWWTNEYWHEAAT